MSVLTKSVVVIFLLKNCEKLLHCASSSYFFSNNGSGFTYSTFENLTSR